MLSGDLLTYERYLVFGAARSGLAAAKLLVGMGKEVVLFDEATGERFEAMRARADEIGAPLLNDPDAIKPLDAWRVMILSPGVPLIHPIVFKAEDSGCLVRSELELGFQACPRPIVAITGTNGKTTTTNLVAHVFEKAGRPTLAAGNVGRPLCDAVLDPKIEEPEAVVACEVSSFQLETIEAFAPDVACVLNITPDHMDRYPTTAHYVEAKYRITENQNHNQALVFNSDDRMCRSFLPRTSATPWEFSVEHPVVRGAWLEEDTLYYRGESDIRPVAVMPRDAIPLRGMHNVANVLATLTIGGAMGLAPEAMRPGVESFEPVEHRIEPVGEIDGVRYFNDSKATNLDSTGKALESFSEPVILIAGGRDKGSPWDPMAELVKEHVKGLVMMGEAADIGMEAWGPVVETAVKAGDMEEAVQKARDMAAAGDVVLLSPGCASFDMFENYERRGECFRATVERIASEGRS